MYLYLYQLQTVILSILQFINSVSSIFRINNFLSKIIVIIMQLSPKTNHEQNRISYFSVRNRQNQQHKIKTQPVESSRFLTKINFKTQNRIPINTSYVDKNKSTQQVFMRKHKNNQIHSKYPSEMIFSQTNLTQRTQRQTQRQKFIKQLNTRVILSKSNSIIQELSQKRPNLEGNQRYEKELSNSKLERSRVKSIGSVEDFIDRDIQKPGKNSLEISVVNIKSAKGESNEQNTELRDRSRTFAKDFSKIVEDNLNIRKKTWNSDQGKIIQANNIENLLQISQSNTINQIITRTVTPHINIPIKLARNQLNKSQILTNNIVNLSAERDTNRGSSSDRNNTQKYEEQVQQITKEFLNDWETMNATKTNLYQKFRNKIVKQYPTMRKKYKESELLPAQSFQRSKKASSSINTPGLQSSIKISFNNPNQNSEMNYLTVTQLRQETQRVQKNEEKWKEQQKKTLKEIFKQAYFYSKAKGRCLSVKYQKTEEELEQQRKIRYIQKNMTFMKYINKKESKVNITNGKKIRGDNILKNKDSILQLQKEGSSKQDYLLKCLDNAIQDCLSR